MEYVLSTFYPEGFDNLITKYVSDPYRFTGGTGPTDTNLSN